MAGKPYFWIYRGKDLKYYWRLIAFDPDENNLAIVCTGHEGFDDEDTCRKQIGIIKILAPTADLLVEPN